MSRWSIAAVVVAIITMGTVPVLACSPAPSGYYWKANNVTLPGWVRFIFDPYSYYFDSYYSDFPFVGVSNQCDGELRLEEVLDPRADCDDEEQCPAPRSLVLQPGQGTDELNLARPVDGGDDDPEWIASFRWSIWESSGHVVAEASWSPGSGDCSCASAAPVHSRPMNVPYIMLFLALLLSIRQRLTGKDR